MRKLFFSITLSSFLFLSCSATTLHFDIKNNSKSNEILKEFADKNCEGRKYAVISHYYDIDNDNKPEIIGIVKSKSYYSSSGYKLIVLRKNGSNWENIKTDIFLFVNLKPQLIHFFASLTLTFAHLGQLLAPTNF